MYVFYNAKIPYTQFTVGIFLLLILLRFYNAKCPNTRKETNKQNKNHKTT